MKVRFVLDVYPDYELDADAVAPPDRELHEFVQEFPDAQAFGEAMAQHVNDQIAVHLRGFRSMSSKHRLAIPQKLRSRRYGIMTRIGIKTIEVLKS